MSARKITVEWDDGYVGTFESQPDGTFHHVITGGPTGAELARPLAVVNYDAANVLRVLATAVGTREIADDLDSPVAQERGT